MKKFYIDYGYKVGDYIMFKNGCSIIQITTLEDFQYGRDYDLYNGEGIIIAKIINDIIVDCDLQYRKRWLNFKDSYLISDELLNKLNKFLTFRN